MKDQYVGDINDLLKYALLRRIAPASGLPLVVAWMRTEADGRADGSQTAYLRDPHRFRPLDEQVFDELSRIVNADTRTLEAVVATRLLEGRHLTSSLLDPAPARDAYFHALEALATEPSFVFLDPDNGMEVVSCKRGARGSSKYLYMGEVLSLLAAGHSLCIYQHHPREERASHVLRRLAAIVAAEPRAVMTGVSSSRIAFLTVTLDRAVGEMLRSAAHAFATTTAPAFDISVIEPPRALSSE